MLMDQSSRDDTLDGFRPSLVTPGDAVSSQSSKDKHHKRSREFPMKKEGSAISTLSLVPVGKPPTLNRWTAWLIWRQQRANQAGVTALAALISALLMVAISELRQADVLGLHACLASGTGPSCATASSLLSQASQQLRILKVALLVMPVIIGMFAGAPLIAREHESGITRYSRTQGLAAEYLIAGTLVVNGAVIATVAAIAGLMFNWATGLANIGMGFTVSPSTFPAQFPALPAWSVLSYILGVACGSLIRRTVPAMAATLIGYGSVLYLAQRLLRPHYDALIFWGHYPRGANLFWPYQVIESTWLVITAAAVASLLVTIPGLARKAAWQRAARRAGQGER